MTFFQSDFCYQFPCHVLKEMLEKDLFVINF